VRPVKTHGVKPNKPGVTFCEQTADTFQKTTYHAAEVTCKACLRGIDALTL
jgi:hypothetical protein